MKTLKSLFSLFLMIASLNVARAAVTIPSQTERMTYYSTNSGSQFKATCQNGTCMVYVNLPEVEIVGIRPKSQFLVGIKQMGSYMPQAQLPMIEIIATRSGSNRIPALKIDGETLGVADVPLIEIVSDYPNQNIIAAGQLGIAVVNLGTIDIIDTYINSKMQSNPNYTLYSSIIPFNWEINKIKNRSFSKSETDEYINSNLGWFYQSLKKCGIDISKTDSGKDITSVQASKTITGNRKKQFLVTK